MYIRLDLIILISGKGIIRFRIISDKSINQMLGLTAVINPIICWGLQQ